MTTDVMSPKHFLPESEMPPEFSYPKQYIEFVERNKHSPVAMLGMPPWLFAGDLLWAKNESIAEFGVLLVPFAQAQGMDMLSYFEVSGGDNPRVLVANPWEQLPDFKVKHWFNSFDDWLSFAEKVSSEALGERPHLAQKSIWFPERAR